MFLETGHLRVAVEDHLEQCRARAREAHEQHVLRRAIGSWLRGGRSRPGRRAGGEGLGQRARVGERARLGKVPIRLRRELVAGAIGGEGLRVAARGIEHVTQQAQRAGAIPGPGAAVREQRAQRGLGARRARPRPGRRPQR